MGRKPIDLTNQKFGQLTVIKEAGRTKNNNVIWECVCECGKVTSVPAGHLRSGHVKSCGCAKGRNVTHGMSGTRLYKIHTQLKARCFNQNHPSYKYYGARGITLCEEWLKFEGFRDWALTNGYTDVLAIERLDFNGNYEPSNCRWVAVTEQPHKPNTRLVTMDDETHTLSAWARKLHVCVTTMRKMFEDVSRELAKAAEAFGTLDNVRQMPDHEVTTPNNEVQ